ncbi:MAG TPA: DEAD/DEAH box helicase [Aeromicrobium sp.]|nr:DEAD/DEAH box helicase [Aeromicrobium sp.]
MTGHLLEFRKLYAFPFDPFQVEACEAVEAGHGVLVAAPTGSGKTLVGEFAVHLALATGRKCFYTTPIKALSNQKFTDLVERYGPGNVGLLTGDNSINGEAPIVVMTTEVLRNMLYAGSRTLLDLGFVVMDEVHYLADRARGAVWEEVIIGLPESVSVISLSATVSNVEEFGAWLTEVRGDTVTIVEERRPVPLHQHVLVGRHLHPLFEEPGAGAKDAEARVNRQLERMAHEDRFLRGTKQGRGGRGHRDGGGRHRSRHRTPTRVELVEKLATEELLPAIVFVFSRAGCSAAVQQCLDAKLLLTNADERAEIERAVDDATAHLPDTDLSVLGFYELRDALGRGIAAHHAGMLPAFKEVVEGLFSQGLLKVVFATETLALGINMPARTVAIERLSKWNGETHVDVTPGEYTQLTGRAGRRGLDIEGHAVVLWQNGFDPRQVAGLASTRTYPLTSSFRPSYNMAVNLVRQFGREKTRALLEQSFAQFQADRSVVGLATQIRKADEALKGYLESATCHLGDFMEYQRLRRELSDLESAGSKSRRAERRSEVVRSLEALKPGDVIRVPGGRWAGLAVVLDPGGRDANDPRPFVLTAGRHARRLALVDFPTPVTPVTRMRVPKSFNPRNAQSRRDLAARLASVVDLPTESGSKPRDAARESPEITDLRRRIRSHPCHACPDRESHARWAERYVKLQRDTDNQRRRIETRTNTVARQFDRVCEVLDALQYLDGDTVTEPGKRLQRIYGELDLVVSESLRHGLWDDLDAPELAAVVSALTFETRADDVPVPLLPTKRVRAVADEMARLAGDLQQLERDHRLKTLRPLDFGFAQTVWEWASGGELDDVLAEADIAPGDFVRAVKQVIDALGQISDAAATHELRETARAALVELRRGVIAYSSALE